ncbi:MAG: deoxyribose-phosphate aldolase [Myxococcales bacterium FL481]|nr:MAG: deoxyribose-phosphate aldolase [Myxococcales bacterium FL481]
MRQAAPQTPLELAARIDHTLLRADATTADITRLCEVAAAYRFHAVCIQPWYVRHAARCLAPNGPVICTVVGFPHGTSRVKAREAEVATEDGAHELDMVIAVGPLLDGAYAEVRDDITAVVRAGAPSGVKVIVESARLSAPQLDAACELSVEAGAKFVKTSTGFGPGGATCAAVARMRSQVQTRAGVKASGGIRDLETARRMIAAGADRLGTSGSTAIVDELRRRQTSS